jgi:glycosyltransferase involved in cell wall biosynthesis
MTTASPDNGTEHSAQTGRDVQALRDHAQQVDDVLSRARGLRMFSTLPFTKVAFWREAVTTLPQNLLFPPAAGGRLAWSRWAITRLLRTWRAAAKADVVLINGGERIDLAALAIGGLLPWIRAPHVIVDAHWNVATRPFPAWVQRLTFRLGRRLLGEVQPHSPEEIPIYVQHFGIPASVVRPLPWSTSLTGYDHVTRRVADTEEADHDTPAAIVCGGHSYRDYDTLLKAVAGQAWPVRIGLPPSPITDAVARAAQGLPNVSIVSDWTFTRYWQQVADSRVFVMPITPGLTRCTADQTLLNALALGATVVATSALSSRLYIRDGVNGFLVPEGDPQALRKALERAWTMSADDRGRMREQALQDTAGPFNEVRRLADTLERAIQVAKRQAR